MTNLLNTNKMALKKKKEEAPASLNIEQAAALFIRYYNEKKEAEKNEKRYKEMLVEHVKQHPELVNDGKAELPDGVVVELRRRLKGSYDEDKMSMDWLNDFVDEPGCAEAVTIKLDEKVLLAGVETDRARQLLEDIAFMVEENETYAVTVR